MRAKFINIIKNNKKKTIALVIVLITYYFCLPDKIFNDPTSTVLEASNGILIGAKIADDGQWRFPHCDSVPEKIKKSITCFEDQYFYYHPGINPISIGKSLITNIKQGKKKRGGSTLTMQVIRLSRKGKSRTYLEKIIEIFLATRLELRKSKEEILALYVSNAPFGGNVVGLNTASWRYFGRNAWQLSWSESATLAVLPNAPSLIYPGKNHIILKKKRDRLLNKLFKEGIIDSTTCELSKLEPLPIKPKQLPQIATHLLSKTLKEHKGKRVVSTIDLHLQKRVNHIVNLHHNSLKKNEIYNAAVLVLEVKTGNVLAYCGNTKNDKAEHCSDVDIIPAPRSTGSILKPLLYAGMLSSGEILPNTLVPDIPTYISGYTPKNFNLQYVGAVPAKNALSRSLNIPAVKMLQKFGVEKLHHILQKLGMSTITYNPEHYGLSLILGGAEGSLWDISGIYAGLSRTLINFQNTNGKYYKNDIREPNYIISQESKNQEIVETSIVSAASIYHTYQSLVDVNRPTDDAGWEYFSSAGKIAWKTGTSFGFRDAWAIGTTPGYVVGVWVGNADGEGRPGLVGLETAAPIMLDVFDLLPDCGWFYTPYDEMQEVAICSKSGHRKGQYCNEIDSVYIPVSGLKTTACPYHKLIHLDSTKQYRVNDECEYTSNMKHEPWFILPPVQEWYYKRRNHNYKTLPPFRNDCGKNIELKTMEFLYPKESNQIYIPVELDGKQGEVIFEVAHRDMSKNIFWHLDNEYIGSTKNIHKLALSPKKGKHIITIVDENGEMISTDFEIISEKL